MLQMQMWSFLMEKERVISKETAEPLQDLACKI